MGELVRTRRNGTNSTCDDSRRRSYEKVSWARCTVRYAGEAVFTHFSDMMGVGVWVGGMEKRRVRVGGFVDRENQPDEMSWVGWPGRDGAGRRRGSMQSATLRN
jgi:hypothetical protein